MNEKLTKQLTEYVQQADSIENQVNIGRWADRVTQFLKQSLGGEAAASFQSLTCENPWNELALRAGHLEGLAAKHENTAILQGSYPMPGYAVPAINSTSQKVFVVHGHDTEAKESVARFLEKLGLEPIILHEQPNQGRTVIEKFEVSSREVAFAVVLLTPDDLGCPAKARSELRARARTKRNLRARLLLGPAGSDAGLCSSQGRDRIAF